MPATEVIFYRELDGSVPILDWLEEAGQRDRRGVEKCTARLEMLGQYGHELRRPIADYLRDGIYELRIRSGRIQYRILYFFHGQNAVVVAHGLMKEKKVPPMDIELAISRKLKFKRSPARHSFREEA
jgi:phage-related protein